MYIKTIHCVYSCLQNLKWNLYVSLLKFNNVNEKTAVKSENVDLNPGFCFRNHLLAIIPEIFPSAYVQVVAGTKKSKLK